MVEKDIRIRIAGGVAGIDIACARSRSVCILNSQAGELRSAGAGYMHPIIGHIERSDRRCRPDADVAARRNAHFF